MKSEDDKIITEAYHKFLGGWDQKSFGDKFGATLKKFLKSKDFLKEIDDKIISKDLFSFKDILSKIEKPKIDGGGKYGVILTFESEIDLDKESVDKLVFGSEGEDKKNLGLIYNDDFEEYLEDCDFSKDSDPFHSSGSNKGSGNDNDDDAAESDAGSDDDDIAAEECSLSISNESFNVFSKIYKNILLEDDDNDDDASEGDAGFGEDDGEGEGGGESEGTSGTAKKSPSSLKLILKIVFNDFAKVEKAKTKDKFNPNYTTKASGKIYLFFNKIPNGTEIGKVHYSPKRTADQDPKKSFWEEMKEQTKAVWKKPPEGKLTSDADITTALAKAAFSRLSAPSLFSKTVQEEDFDLEITSLTYDNAKLNDKNEIKRRGSPEEVESNIQEDLDTILADTPYTVEFKNSRITTKNSKHYSLTFKDKNGKVLTLYAMNSGK